MKRVFILFAAAIAGAGAGCGGNYSNEDLDFQLALPEREDIAVKLPSQSLESNDSGEQYRITRGTVKSLNGTADAFLSLIDYVRAYPPSERKPGRRIWGPFPADHHPEWLVRMVMDRIGDPGQPTRFEYSVEVRPRAAADAPWAALITGSFAPKGGVRRGEGAFHFTAAAARAAGYPLDGLAGTDRLDIGYSTAAHPVGVRIEIVTFPTNEKSTYQYSEDQDGSGSMLFTFPTPNLAPRVTSLEIRSRWKGSGAGRADVKVLAGNAQGMNWVECWGIDTRATYVHRDWAPLLDMGMESTCVFDAP